MGNAHSSSFVATTATEPSLTASAIVAPAVSRSHILRIDGYSRINGLGNGKSIASGTFSVGGRRWCLKYYPDSYSLKDSEWVSVFLHLDYNTTLDEVVKASFQISLLDQDGNPVPSFSNHSPLCSFSSTQHTMGYKLIKRSDLEGSVHLKEDKFSVRCDVTVAGEIFTSKAIPVSEVLRRLVKQEKLRS